MSVDEIIAELPKLERKELERVDACLHELISTMRGDEPVSDETHAGLDDFPKFSNSHLSQEYVGRDAIYDARGR